MAGGSPQHEHIDMNEWEALDIKIIMIHVTIDPTWIRMMNMNGQWFFMGHDDWQQENLLDVNRLVFCIGLSAFESELEFYVKCEDRVTSFELESLLNG